MEDLKQKIKRIRKEKRISQAELAESAGISRISYTYFENGTTDKLSLDAAVGIAKALDMSFNELFDIPVKTDDMKIRLELTKEIENLKSEFESQYNQIVLSRDLYKERLELTQEKLRITESSNSVDEKLLNEFFTKTTIHESLHFLDKDLFERKFPEVVQNLELNTVYESEIVERLYNLFGDDSYYELLNFVDIQKFENTIAFTKFLSKFEVPDLKITKKELIKQIKEEQFAVRKELNL